MTENPSRCSLCHDEGRVVRKLVVGTQGGDPVILDGWLPCACPAGEDIGEPCTICYGVGSIYVEFNHSPNPETMAALHPCDHCGGTGAEPSPSLLDAALRFFEDDGWEISQQPDHPILWMGFEGENGDWKCCLQIREEEEQVLFYSICPRRTEPAQRANMAEFLTRANYGMVIGNFEMDYSDGEVRFKSSIDVENAHLTRALLHHVVYANLLMTDKYLPGVISVMEGHEPAFAIDLVEGKPN